PPARPGLRVLFAISRPHRPGGGRAGRARGGQRFVTRPCLRMWMKLPLCAMTLALCACTADEAEVAPPRHGFYYPTGMATSGADEAFLFVSSANADLRFAAGTVQTIDLDAVEAVADAWETSEARGA